MLSYFLEETITNTTQGFWLLLTMIVSVVAIQVGIKFDAMFSQSGKAARVEKFESKRKNHRNAEKRKAIERKRKLDHIRECQKHSKKKDRKESKKILYNSQLGEEEEFYNDVKNFLGNAKTFTADAWQKAKPLISNNFSFEKYYTIFGYIKACKLTCLFCDIFDILISLEMMENFVIKIEGWDIYVPRKRKGKTKITDLFEASYLFAKAVKKAYSEFPTRGFAAFYGDGKNGLFEEDYTYVTSHNVLIDTGAINTEEDIKSFDLKLQRAIDTCNSMIGANSERSYYTPKLRELKVLQAKRIASQKDFIRMKPYGILLTGGSSVGKSSIANALTRYILSVNDFPSSANSVVVLNEADKFQSEFRTYHTGVILDDLCNSTVDTTDGNPLLKVIQFINNSPQSALNPNAEMKGNVMIEPRVVLATTNVKGLNAAHYSNEPLSIARRFDVTVTQKVKPKYRLLDSEMLDTAKVAEDFSNTAFPDFAMFTVERPTLSSGNIRQGMAKKARVSYTPVIFEGKELVDVNLRTLMSYLKFHTGKHFAEQKSFVKTQRENVDIELDEFGFPVGMAREEEFDSQMAILDEFIDKYEALEDLAILKFSHFVKYMLGVRMVRNYIYGMYAQYFNVAFMIIIYGSAVSQNMSLRGGLLVIASLYALRYCFYRVACYYILWRIRRVTRLSTWFRSCSWVDKIGILSCIGGVATLSFFGTLVTFMSEKLSTAKLPSESADCIHLEPNEIVKDENKGNEFWDEHQRYKRFLFNPKMQGNARTTTQQQLVNIISRRILMIHIETKKGNMQFCNCLPIRGNMALIPAHIVPDFTAKAIVTKVGANPKRIVISRDSCYRIPNTDVCVWYVPELGDQRDLTAYFPGTISHKKQYVGHVVYNDHGESKVFSNILGTRGTSKTTLGGKFESINYYFPDETFQGLCMATFVAKDNRDMPFIGGFHLGGKKCSATAGFITKEQVLEAIDQIAKKPSVLPSHAGQAFNTQMGDINVGPLKEPHGLCVTRKLDGDARCVVYGAHNKPASTPSSEVVVSSISEKVTEILGLERKHDKPYAMQSQEHKLVDIENKSHTAYKFDSRLLDKAVVDFDMTLKTSLKGKLHRLGKLSDDVVLAGLDGVVGINAMNLKTACGFPMAGPKTKLIKVSERKVKGITRPLDVDPKVLVEIARLEKVLLNGDRINAVFKASLKDEPTKIGKKKVRVFAGCNIYFIMLVRKYFLTISALMQENKQVFECAVGLNVESPEWTTMMKHVYKFGKHRTVAGDYKSFDGRMSPRVMLASFKILINLAEESGNYDADDLTIMRGIATEICSPTYDFFGTLVQFYGSNPSGHPLTVVTNSLVNSLYMRYVYYKIAAEEKWWRVPLFKEVVALMTYGDDNIMSVKKGYDAYNHTNIARVLSECDITYTMADKEAESVPFIDGSEAGFLKHNAVWDDELQLYRARIEESSISKMLHAHGRSAINEQLHAACTIKDALDKYAHFGDEIYTKRCAQLKQVAEECNIIGLIGHFPTYREQILKYCGKYSWAENPYPPTEK